MSNSNEIEVINLINKKFDSIYNNYIKIGLFENYVENVHINMPILQTYGFQINSIEENNNILISLCDYLNNLKIVFAEFCQMKVGENDYYYALIKRNIIIYNKKEKSLN